MLTFAPILPLIKSVSESKVTWSLPHFCQHLWSSTFLLHSEPKKLSGSCSEIFYSTKALSIPVPWTHPQLSGESSSCVVGGCRSGNPEIQPCVRIGRQERGTKILWFLGIAAVPPQPEGICILSHAAEVACAGNVFPVFPCVGLLSGFPR